MKKILLIIFILLIGKILFSQNAYKTVTIKQYFNPLPGIGWHPTTTLYPVSQAMGSDKTLITSRGGFTATQTFIMPAYADTAGANANNPYTSSYPASMIWSIVDSSIYVLQKSTFGTYWFRVAGAGGGATGSFWSILGNTFVGPTPAARGIGTNSVDDLGFKTSGTIRVILGATGFSQISDTTLNKPMTYNTSTQAWNYGSWFGGGGSGSTNSNVGSGYRWAIPNTNNIKTFSVTNGLTADSATSNQIGIVLGGTLTANTTISFPHHVSLTYGFKRYSTFVIYEDSAGTINPRTITVSSDTASSPLTIKADNVIPTGLVPTEQITIWNPKRTGNASQAMIRFKGWVNNGSGLADTAIGWVGATTSTYITNPSLASTTYLESVTTGGVALLGSGTTSVLRGYTGGYTTDAFLRWQIEADGNQRMFFTDGQAQSLNYELTANNATATKSYVAQRVKVTTSGTTTEIIGTGNTYSNVNVNVAANSYGILQEIAGGCISLIGGDATSTLRFNAGGYAVASEQMRISSSGVGIGTTTISAKLHVISTTEQLRVGYDASNYYSATVGSTGVVTFNAVGAGQAFTFSDPITNTNAQLTTPTVITSAIIPLVNGSSSASGNLQLQSTSNGTKGKIDILDSANFNGRSIENYSAKYNAQTGTSYTLVSADNGKIVTCNNASAITLTIPAGLPTGFTCTVIQLGAGAVTFTASSTTLHNRSSFTKTAGQYAVAAITMYSADTFIFAGDCQ